MSGQRAVVIGSGMGGLTSAVLLAQRGWRVEVHEQHTRPGGFLHRFFRDTHPYDTGFHYCGGIGFDDLLGRALRHLGVFDRLGFLPLDPDGFDRLLLPGIEFDVPVGIGALRDRLVDRFPGQAAGIDGLLADIESAAAEYGLYAFNAEIDAPALLHWEGQSLADVVARHISDPLLRALLCAQFPLYGVPPDEAPFGLHAVILHHFLRGAWRVDGGGDALARALVQRIRELGGSVHLKSEVSAVRVEDRHARGVVLASGEERPADLVISNAHPRLTLSMLPEGSVRRASRTRITGQRPGIAHLGVYIELDGHGVPELGNRNLYRLRHLDPKACIHDSHEGDVGFYFLTAPGESRRGGDADPRRRHDVLLALAPLSWEAVEQWQDSRAGDRPDAYRRVKERATKAVLDAIFDDFPSLRSRVRRVEASTPLTTAHFVRSPHGAMYGHYHSVDQMGRNRLPQFLRVRGLIQVGAAVLFPGVLGAMVSAYYGVGAMVGMQTLVDELNAVPREDP